MQEEINTFNSLDMLPEDQNYYTFLKKVFRHEFRKNGFRRLSTPILEKEELFKMAFGEDFLNDKALFEKDKIFRFSGNIPVLRAYIDGGFSKEIQPTYFYYIDRFISSIGLSINESFQIGGEIIGESDPILDSLLIYISYRILNEIGLENKFKIKINSIGTPKERIKYLDELKSFYENKRHLLSFSGIEKLNKNPFLLLNSPDEDEKILAAQVPKFSKFLKKDSKAYYLKVKEYLDILEVSYEEDNSLISIFDFNTDIIWEIQNDDYGIISNGARYNGLSEKISDLKEIPATGFSFDVYKLINLLKDNNIKLKNKDKIDLYFVQLGDEAKKVVFPLSLEARIAGINTLVSLGTPSMKEQILKANRSQAKFIVIVGMMEARNGVFQVRNTEEGTQEEVKKEDLINYVIDKIGKEQLDFYSPSKDFIIN